MSFSSEMRKGTAGEYIVCADLLLKGLPAVLAGAAEAYDVLVDFGTIVKRVQVKSSSLRNNRYVFTLTGGRGSDLTNKNRPSLDLTQFEILACVALDTKKVAYVPFEDIINPEGKVKRSFTLHPHHFEGTCGEP